MSSWQHATATHCGAAIARDAVLPTIGLPLLDALEAYAPGQGAVLFATYQEHNGLWHDQLARLVPGTPQMLARLRAAGCLLGVVSSKRRDIMMRGVDLFALGPTVDTTVALEDTARPKPAPDPLLCALQRLGHVPDPRRTAYVGDAPGDMAAARAAGMRAIGVAWGAAAPAVLTAAGAEVVLTGWDALLHLAAEAP